MFRKYMRGQFVRPITLFNGEHTESMKICEGVVSTSQIFVTVLAASLGFKYIPLWELSNNCQWN